jgi:hypothetical protein
MNLAKVLNCPTRFLYGDHSPFFRRHRHQTTLFLWVKPPEWIYPALGTFLFTEQVSNAIKLFLLHRFRSNKNKLDRLSQTSIFSFYSVCQKVRCPTLVGSGLPRKYLSRM